MKRIWKCTIFFLLAAVLFTACSAQTLPDTKAAAGSPAAAAPDSSLRTPSEKEPEIDEATGKIKLTLAGVGMQTYGWDRLAKAFNAQSEDYVVELRDYYTGSFVDDGTSAPDDMEQYRDDLADAKTRLHTDLIVGKLPDLIVFDGLSPLTLVAELYRCARVKSEDMHDAGYFSHESPTYGSPFDMMLSFGLSYAYAGENIAKGYGSAEAVVNAWMNSSGHRANILSANFTRLGVGYVADGGYWTQWFLV